VEVARSGHFAEHRPANGETSGDIEVLRQNAASPGSVARHPTQRSRQFWQPVPHWIGLNARTGLEATSVLYVEPVRSRAALAMNTGMKPRGMKCR